jgi:hypothetical protein
LDSKDAQNVKGSKIFDRLYLSLNSEQHLHSKVAETSDGIVNISMVEFCGEIDDSLEYMPISLEDIHAFHELVTSVQEKYPSSSIVVCTGPVQRTQFGTIFLLGCYLLLIGLELEDLNSIFARYQHIILAFECHGLSIEDFWSAIHRAKIMGWVDLEHIPETPQSITSWIDIEEYIHYSRCIRILTCFPFAFAGRCKMPHHATYANRPNVVISGPFQSLSSHSLP